MNYLTLANTIQAGLFVLIALLVVFYVLRQIRLDDFRQKMFTLRDELFDFAADGHISFNDPAYVLLRRQMNGMIQYAHQLTLFRVLATGAARSVAGLSDSFEWNNEWESALDSLPVQTEQKLNQFHERGMMLAARYFLLGSPNLLASMFVVACVLLTGEMFKRSAVGLRSLLKNAARVILKGPLDQRLIEEEAVAQYI